MFNKVKFVFKANGKCWMPLVCVWLCASWSRGAVYTVTTTADSGAGSFRQAILDADTDPGPNSIVFQISGTPPFTITPLTVLPALGNPTTIDGTTQNGFTSAPVIELNGASAGATAAGLQLLSGFSTVRGLAINRFSLQGIVLSGPANVIQGNYLGTDVTGALARGNGSFGIWVESSGNLIGGTNSGNGNVISGGNDTGIYISNTSSNTVQGNLIGLTVAGASALGNTNNGVVIDGGGGNLIGGTNSGARNVISGNGQSGVYLYGSGATGNRVQGNYIGVGISGSMVVSNANDGITLNGAPGNTIGSAASGGGNVISGNGFSGVAMDTGGASNNIVLGNFIGTGATGMTALGNQNAGVTISAAAGNQVGGTNSGARNVISGNGQSGVYLYGSGATGNCIQGNYIGLGISGSIVVSNANDGITINGVPGNTIGGGNVISGNGFSGVAIDAGGASNNLVLGNFIGTDTAGKTALGNQNAGVTISAGAGNQIGGTNSGAGNVISGNKQDGIFLTVGAAGNLIEGNLIGLSAAGTNAIPNGFNGISLSGAVSNIIGGVVPAARNLISGNTFNGVGILAVTDTLNTICGNYIGTDVTGKKAVANVLAGVRVQGCSNVIGGVTAGSGNLISGNGQQGVWLVGLDGNVTGNAIQGNLIGLDGTGISSLPNGNAGVGISSAAGNHIGGTASGARNVISANDDAGIVFIGAGTTGNQVQGNYIGTDATGALGRGNRFEGIYMQGSLTNSIGGNAAGAGNLISGNNTRGLWLTNASWNVIQGNFIGTQADGTNALGNAAHGIDLDVNATNNTVGGAAAGAGNRIAFAQTNYAGVRVRTGALNNLISGNAIFNNGALGIDLGNNGVNTSVDCENGVAANAANKGQNYPVLTNVYSGTATQIRGTLDSGAGKTYLLQFFSSPAGDPSGYGEGQVFLGQTNLTLGATMCSSNFTVLLPVSVPAGWVITATATDSANNTSEFSAWTNVVVVPQVLTSAVNPASRQFSISWTNNGGSYVLQQTHNLSPPAQWSVAGGAPWLMNGFFVETMPATNSSTFYRLIAQ